MWEMRETGSSHQWTPVLICRTRPTRVRLPSSNQEISDSGSVFSRCHSPNLMFLRTGHVVVDVLGEEFGPLGEFAGVEELGLVIEEALYLVLEEQALQGLLVGGCCQGHVSGSLRHQ